MQSLVKRQKSVINLKQAVTLLYPIAAFFQSSGMRRTESIAALSAAIDRVCSSDRMRRMEHIGAFMRYADLIGVWTRDRNYLDSNGRPRVLSISGTNGFRALVKRASPGSDPKEALKVLVRYQNVRRLPHGRVRLVSPYFRTSTEKKMAFEPIAYFLSDATSTLTRILRTAPAMSAPETYWTKVESSAMTNTAARKFSQFAKERSLLFLEELEDWLQAHNATITAKARGHHRIGVGLFSYYSANKDAKRLRP